jgi:uncharacterized protein (DUF433 family)
MPSKVIQHRKGSGGVSAYVGDSRVRVSDIAQLYETLLAELVVERIREALPHLAEAEITEAIRYWRAHPQEIAEEIERDEVAASSLESAV